MTLAKRYDSPAFEAELTRHWDDCGVYDFRRDDDAPVFAIDTPPPSVSGALHLGHVYSYTHADFFARYRRMRGDNIFYPMGFDDNGLPTERLVERKRGVRAAEVGRAAFIRECLEVAAASIEEYKALWRRLGLSIDWRYTYRTIDDDARRTSQAAFLALLRRGLAYRREAPTIWCPECRTAIAQAELNDLARETTYYTLRFALDDGRPLPIATTRPELLPACAAVLVHPDDERYRELIGRQATTPLGCAVPILADRAADPAKGTGAVMCCTFGDTADIAWQREHDLPIVAAIGRDGRMTPAAGRLAGLTTGEARGRLVAELDAGGLLLAAKPAAQTVRVHERCDTPVEYIVSRQWFIQVLAERAAFLEAGERIAWHPEHMGVRYRQWVENLHSDWCISRQRAFGVPFPVWYCAECGEIATPDEADLPIDPAEQGPKRPCACGGTTFTPEKDVMDTWATSSLSPQIVGRWLGDEALFGQVFPMTLRPQAHEIIRTWAFYTIVRAHYHNGRLPWSHVAISGWGLAPEGAAKLSKSRGGGETVKTPDEAIDAYSADAVRYWAAGAGLGKDTVISEERMQTGARWVTKLWNVARFAERFLAGYRPPATPPDNLSTADRWLLARLNQVTAAAMGAFEGYDYATARAEVESFFWRDLADNYLEMAKQRLYEPGAGYEAARYTLHRALLTTIKLLAPIMPYVTEAIYRGPFTMGDGTPSIHRTLWPEPEPRFDDLTALQAGEALIDVATAVRRFKSERGLALGAEVAALHVHIVPKALAEALRGAEEDLRSITRARTVLFEGDGQGTPLPAGSVEIRVAL